MRKNPKNMKRAIIITVLLASGVLFINILPGGTAKNPFAFVVSLSSSEKDIALTKINLNSLTISDSKLIVVDEPILPLFVAIDNSNQKLFLGCKSRYPLWVINPRTFKTITRFDSEWQGDDFRRAPTIYWILPYNDDKIYFYGSEFDTIGDMFFAFNPVTMEIMKKTVLQGHPMILSKDRRFIISTLSEPILAIYSTETDSLVFSVNLAKKYNFETEHTKVINEIQRQIHGIVGQNGYFIKCDTVRQYQSFSESLKILHHIEIYNKDSGLIYRIATRWQKIGNRVKSNKYIAVTSTSTGEVVDSIPFPVELASKNRLDKLIEIDSFFINFKYLADENGFVPPLAPGREISVSPDGKYIFWPIDFFEGSYIIVIDTKTKQVVKRIPIGGGHITNVVFGYE